MLIPDNMSYTVTSFGAQIMYFDTYPLYTEVVIALGRGLDGRALISGRGTRFTLLYSVQTYCGAYQASYPMGTGICVPGATAARAWS
jgi:hypothetical protein